MWAHDYFYNAHPSCCQPQTDCLLYLHNAIREVKITNTVTYMHFVKGYWLTHSVEILAKKYKQIWTRLEKGQVNSSQPKGKDHLLNDTWRTAEKGVGITNISLVLRVAGPSGLVRAFAAWDYPGICCLSRKNDEHQMARQDRRFCISQQSWYF